MLRLIREDEAPSLPRKLTSMGAGASDIAARRQTDPASLRRLVDGDLNAITMKALEKDRKRRYQSAWDMQFDIDTFLASTFRLVPAGTETSMVPRLQLSKMWLLRTMLMLTPGQKTPTPIGRPTVLTNGVSSR